MKGRSEGIRFCFFCSANKFLLYRKYFCFHIDWSCGLPLKISGLYALAFTFYCHLYGFLHFLFEYSDRMKIAGKI